MPLTKLQINYVRNLRQVNLPQLHRANVFFGPNGSGKTSVLESIHLLGMARSFRGSAVKSLITHEQQSCTVFGAASASRADPLRGPGSAPELPIGVRRNRVGEAEIKVGGKPVRTVAALAEQLPLQVITADSFGLLTGAPAARRQYLDWGVFHVEQRFFTEWKRFRRSIKQRNNLLRRGKVSPQELLVWSQDLARSGTAIHQYREAYFEALYPFFRSIMARLAPALRAVELRYQRGWDRQLSYAEALQQGLRADLDQGYTHTGPQRADIKVLLGSHLASETLSRGQQKLVVSGLKLAQGLLLAEQGYVNSTYLIDDLPSELDQKHSVLVCELLAAMEAQVFITCIDQRELKAVWPRESELAMFHVEQGAVQAYSGA